MREHKCYLLRPSGGLSLFLLLPLLSLFLPSKPAFSQTQSQNQCIACHTNAKKLIEITRIIKQTTPQPKKSNLTKGEG